MKNLKSHFKFNRQERSGIFFLLLLIGILQVAYLFLKQSSPSSSLDFKLNTIEQQYIDSLKHASTKDDTLKIYPFNPNFISDYKGYTLGMTPEEIDRLHGFRAGNRFVNSASEFQEVTKISDSLLETMSPYFKFPNWINENKPKKGLKKRESVNTEIQDLNLATANDLRNISGIGEKLSARIIKFRDRLGGFLVNEQLYDVYGLRPEVAKNVIQSFQVLTPPNIKKVNINTASVDEIASLVYINYNLAQKIVLQRQLGGAFGSLDELGSIEGFPEEKIDRIKLYLSL